MKIGCEYEAPTESKKILEIEVAGTNEMKDLNGFKMEFRIKATEEPQKFIKEISFTLGDVNLYFEPELPNMISELTEKLKYTFVIEDLKSSITKRFASHNELKMGISLSSLQLSMVRL